MMWVDIDGDRYMKEYCELHIPDPQKVKSQTIVQNIRNDKGKLRIQHEVNHNFIYIMCNSFE